MHWFKRENTIKSDLKKQRKKQRETVTNKRSWKKCIKDERYEKYSNERNVIIGNNKAGKKLQVNEINTSL